jgi:hypothetical protein
MDYDVGITGLSSPPASATKSSYRPAVSVRNNGLHDALASGVLRIYAAGQLIFTSEIYSPTIPPGETKTAEAIDYWTPDTEGFYVIIADVSSPLDQYEPNNHLAPTAIEVTGLPPEPPSPVEPHAAQHEEGGTDELSIDGLEGRTADPQEPLAHVAAHQAGGSDQLYVGGLLGQLAHDQPALAHGNSRHSPSMATSAELAAHQTATTAHASATNLANRDTTGGDVGLLTHTQLFKSTVLTPVGDKYLRNDRQYHCPVPDHTIVIWDGTNPVPDGWLTVVVIPAPPLPYIWIEKLPTASP